MSNFEANLRYINRDFFIAEEDGEANYDDLPYEEKAELNKANIGSIRLYYPVVCSKEVTPLIFDLELYNSQSKEGDLIQFQLSLEDYHKMYMALGKHFGFHSDGTYCPPDGKKYSPRLM